MDPEELVDTDRFDFESFVDPNEPSEVHPSPRWIDVIERGSLEYAPNTPNEWLCNRLLGLFVEASENHGIDVLEFAAAAHAIADYQTEVANAALFEHAKNTDQLHYIEDGRFEDGD